MSGLVGNSRRHILSCRGSFNFSKFGTTVYFQKDQHLTRFTTNYMNKTNIMTCAASKDSSQPGHPPSLISLCCPHEEAFGPKVSIERTAKSLIRLGGCPG